MGQASATLDLSAIRFCPLTTEHPFDTQFTPAQAQSDWVKLVDNDENEYALLLCPHAKQTWVAWLPSQGEVILHREQLCRLPL